MRFVYPDAVIERIPFRAHRWVWTVDQRDGSSVCGWALTFLGAHRAAEKARRERTERSAAICHEMVMVPATCDRPLPMPRTSHHRRQPVTDPAPRPTLTEWTVCVPSSPREVADGLRAIAARVEAEELTLISIYVTGFGEPWEAALQVIVDESPA